MSGFVFCERQSGGLCRMHALNAYFGRAKITPAEFHRYVVIYDAYLKARFNVETSSADFDLVNSDQTNLVSYVLQRHGVHARYYALNTAHGKPLDPDITGAPFVFVYNEGHIWGVRLHGGAHYKVDSIGGVTPFDIQSLRHTRDIGLIVPVPSRDEWRKRVREISAVLDAAGVRGEGDLAVYLRELHAQKMNLGDLEIPLGVAVSIMEMTLTRNGAVRPGFDGLKRICDDYSEFVAQFTAGQYMNLPLVLRYVPGIITRLIALR